MPESSSKKTETTSRTPKAKTESKLEKAEKALKIANQHYKEDSTHDGVELPAVGKSILFGILDAIL